MLCMQFRARTESMQLTELSLDASYAYSPCTIAHAHIQAMAARSTLDSTSILGRLGCVCTLLFYRSSRGRN